MEATAVGLCIGAAELAEKTVPAGKSKIPAMAAAAYWVWFAFYVGWIKLPDSMRLDAVESRVTIIEDAILSSRDQTRMQKPGTDTRPEASTDRLPHWGTALGKTQRQPAAARPASTRTTSPQGNHFEYAQICPRCGKPRGGP